MAKCYYYTVKLDKKRQLNATNQTAAKASELYGNSAGERKSAGVLIAAF